MIITQSAEFNDQAFNGVNGERPFLLLTSTFYLCELCIQELYFSDLCFLNELIFLRLLDNLKM